MKTKSIKVRLEGTNNGIYLDFFGDKHLGYFSDEDLCQWGSKDPLLREFSFERVVNLGEPVPVNYDSTGEPFVPKAWYEPRLEGLAPKDVDVVLDYDNFQVVQKKGTSNYFYLEGGCYSKPVELIAALSFGSEPSVGDETLYGMFDNFCCGEHIDADGHSSYLWFR